jgi:putative NADH-flavin reductase
VSSVAMLGATGRTGRLVVAELLRRGHRVTALVREPGKLGDLAERAGIVIGGSRDPEALAAFVHGADAVLSALGPTAREPTLHRDTATALVTVMNSAGVRRFIGISGAGIDVPGDRKALRDRVISTLIARFGGVVVGDKPAEYQVLADSGLDWTLIRPPRLLDGPATGTIEHDAQRSTRSTSMRRTDLAVFMVDVLEQVLYVRAAPFAATAHPPIMRRRVS